MQTPRSPARGDERELGGPADRAGRLAFGEAGDDRVEADEDRAGAAHVHRVGAAIFAEGGAQADLLGAVGEGGFGGGEAAPVRFDRRRILARRRLERGQRGRQHGERDVAGLADDLPVGGDSPALRPPHPISEIFAVPPRRIAARESEIAVGEALRAVGRDAAADRRPGQAALAEGGAVAEGGEHGVAADGVAGGRRHHHFGVEHRREAVGGARRVRRRRPRRRGRRRAESRPPPRRAGPARARRG